MVAESPTFSTWPISYPTVDGVSTVLTLTFSGATVEVTAFPDELHVPTNNEPLQLGQITSAYGIWMSFGSGMNTIIFGNSPPGALTVMNPAGKTPSSALIPQSTSVQTDESAAPLTSTTASRPTANGSGLSSGAIAGIVIGCIAACALVAGFVFWFCARRRKSFRSQHAQAEEYMLPYEEKGLSPKAVAATGAITSIGTFSQPLEDKAITGDISKISNAIKNHVQSYYHLNRVGSGLIDNEDLQALGSDLPVSLATLTSLMSKAATREMTLRFVIAWVIISKMQPSKDSSKSFLPPEIAQGYEAIVRECDENQALPLVANWRVMTAESMNSKYAHTSIDASDSRYASIQASLTTLDRVLQPFADPRMNDEERKRNLEEVLKRSASFSYTLFSQPSTWKFEWQEGHDVTSGELCIFPALMQVADETGQQIDPPRPFNDAIVRRLDT